MSLGGERLFEITSDTRGILTDLRSSNGLVIFACASSCDAAFSRFLRSDAARLCGRENWPCTMERERERNENELTDGRRGGKREMEREREDSRQ